MSTRGTNALVIAGAVIAALAIAGVVISDVAITAAAIALVGLSCARRLSSPQLASARGCALS